MVQADTKFREEAKQAAERGRAIQAAALKAEKSAHKANGKQAGGEKAPHTRDRKYPVPPLPKQHQDKPGTEGDLKPRPMFDAPDYKGSEKLLDRAAIVTGGDSGI